MRVPRAKNLANVDNIGLSDPYVTVKIAGQGAPQRSNTVYNNCSPEWSQAFFTFSIGERACAEAILEIEVFDEDMVTSSNSELDKIFI